MFENKLSKHILSCILIGIAIFLISCNKDKNSYVSYSRGVESSQEFVYAQQMMTQLMATYFKAINDSSLILNNSSNIDGATVYLVLDESPKKLRIEYPAWGADDGYGHRRQGVYEAYSQNGFLVVNETVEFQFMDFAWDKDSLFVDSMFVFNNGKIDGKNYNYSLSAKKIDLNFSDTTTALSFDMSQSITMLKEAGTIYTSSEDSIGIYGGMQGITTKDLQFDAKCAVDSSMLFSFSCNWLKAGATVIEIENFQFPSTIYFADADTCSNRYLIEIDGNPFPYPFDY